MEPLDPLIMGKWKDSIQQYLYGFLPAGNYGGVLVLESFGEMQTNFDIDIHLTQAGIDHGQNQTPPWDEAKWIAEIKAVDSAAASGSISPQGFLNDNQGGMIRDGFEAFLKPLPAGGPDEPLELHWTQTWSIKCGGQDVLVNGNEYINRRRWVDNGQGGGKVEVMVEAN